MGLRLWTEFFDDLQHIRGRSQNTVLAYRRDLELYDRYQTGGKNITGFYGFMKGQGLSERSQARVISSLRTYFRFMESQGVSVPELRDLKVPRVHAKLPRVLTVEEFQKLQDACVGEDPLKSARNKMTLTLLFGLGCRVSELIDLDVQDLQLSQGVVAVTGKGSKQRLVPLTEFLLKELKVYLEHVRPKLIRKTTSALLINDRGARPSRVDIWRWLASWSQKAGFSEPISPHKFRHGCATALLESGADLRSIQMLLGHASLQTTQIYTNVSTKKLVETIDEHHPLSKMKDL